MINTALAPLRDDLSPLDLGDVPRGSVTSYPHGAAWNMVDLVDPLLVSDRSGSNQTSGWVSVAIIMSSPCNLVSGAS